MSGRTQYAYPWIKNIGGLLNMGLKKIAIMAIASSVVAALFKRKK